MHADQRTGGKRLKAGAALRAMALWPVGLVSTYVGERQRRRLEERLVKEKSRRIATRTAEQLQAMHDTIWSRWQSDALAGARAIFEEESNERDEW
jgi:hypothetical protein